MTQRLLTISLPPHATSPFSTRGIMTDVLIALVPVVLASVYFFGWNVILILVTACAGTVSTEYLLEKFVLKKEPTVSDRSALVTGVLLALNVPSNLPLWMVIFGCAFAIGIGKICYGGLGQNPFNPALIGRVFLLASFPTAMTSWPRPLMGRSITVDAVTAATPLGILKEGVHLGEKVPHLMSQMPSYWDLFVGNRTGCLGEASILAILIGFLYLLYRKVITWHIPVVTVLSAFAFAGIMWIIDPNVYADPLFHILTGGIMLAAVFMATDYTTSPMTKPGMVLYAIGIGLIVIIIRSFGSYPEGISFAVLIMNAFVPLIDRTFKPRRFGEGVR